MKTKLQYYAKPLTKLDEINWKNKLNHTSININTNRFYEIIIKIIEDEVPKTFVIKDQFPKFFSKKFKTNKNKKNRS